MSEPFLTSIEDWSNGVITTTQADEIPVNSSPRGENSTLVFEGAGKAAVAKRQGASLFKELTLHASEVGNSGINGIHLYRPRTGSDLTTHYIIARAVDLGAPTKSLFYQAVSTSGAVTTLGTFLVQGAALQKPTVAAAAINHLFTAAQGGSTDAYKKVTSSLVFQLWGISAPITAPIIADGGGAGNHNGTYEAFVTFFNATGHESSRGIVSSQLSVTNRTIGWSSIPTSTDTQVTGRYLYIRNTLTQTEFFRVATINDNTTTTTTTNVADSSLRIIGPDEDENDPPRDVLIGTEPVAVAWHKSRMFIANSRDLFYSKIGLPESFDAERVEPVAPDDGQSVTALAVYQDLLWIFKDKSTYILNGDDPNTWSIDLIDPSIGCAAQNSISIIEGVLRMWSSEGPVELSGGQFNRIGKNLINETVMPSELNFAEFHLVSAAVDPEANTILFSVPDAGQTRATRLLPYNYRLGRWESSRLDPFDVKVMATLEDGARKPFVMMGLNNRILMKWRDATRDGVPSGTVSGTFTASASSISSLTDSAAAFYTTGLGLVERRITILDSLGSKVGEIRPRITSNTATVLNFTPSVTGLTASASYSYVVGGPAFAWDTKWEDHSEPWRRKRYQFIYLHFGVSAEGVAARVNLFYDFRDDAFASTSQAIVSLGPETGVWDASLWDSSTFGGQASSVARVRAGKVARAVKIRTSNFQADQDLTLFKVGFTGEVTDHNIISP